MGTGILTGAFVADLMHIIICYLIIIAYSNMELGFVGIPHPCYICGKNIGRALVIIYLI